MLVVVLVVVKQTLVRLQEGKAEQAVVVMLAVMEQLKFPLLGAMGQMELLILVEVEGVHL
jgi:hypothetical protein